MLRLCFIAYWLCARLGNEWRAKGEVQRLLRQLQAIRVGTLKIAGQDFKRLLTQIPPELNTLLGLLPLFAQPPAWVLGVARKHPTAHPLPRRLSLTHV
jgi:hypothetical protein